MSLHKADGANQHHVGQLQQHQQQRKVAKSGIKTNCTKRRQKEGWCCGGCGGCRH